MSCAILLFSAVPTLVASWSVSLKPSLPSPLGYMKVGDNFCVSDEGVDLVQLSMPDGNADRDSCAQACSLSNDCSAYEWYTDGWDGNHCFRILASPPAAAADGGSRWRDAECWVRPGYKKVGDNFCVSDEGVDLVQLSMPDGNADRDSCAQACSLSNDCSAYEWYTDGWDGNHCFRILASPPAAAADGGSRWRDAECWVRPTLLPLCQDDDSGDSGFYDMYTCAQIAFWCGPDSPYDEFHTTGTANRCRLSCDPVCESLRS